MIIAGVVIETVPGRQAAVAERLEGVPGLTIKGGDGQNRIAAVWTAPNAQSLEEAVEGLMDLDEEVVGVFPTFVGDDTE
jgi:nitrate reductase NapAB chaperone NapD